MYASWIAHALADLVAIGLFVYAMWAGKERHYYQFHSEKRRKSKNEMIKTLKARLYITTLLVFYMQISLLLKGVISTRALFIVIGEKEFQYMLWS